MTLQALLTESSRPGTRFYLRMVPSNVYILLALQPWIAILHESASSRHCVAMLYKQSSLQSVEDRKRRNQYFKRHGKSRSPFPCIVRSHNFSPSQGTAFPPSIHTFIPSLPTSGGTKLCTRQSSLLLSVTLTSHLRCHMLAKKSQRVSFENNLRPPSVIKPLIEYFANPVEIPICSHKIFVEVQSYMLGCEANKFA